MTAAHTSVSAQLVEARRDIDQAHQLVSEAADQLRALISLPVTRPGAWEANHVIALEHELRDVLALLDGGAQ